MRENTETDSKDESYECSVQQDIILKMEVSDDASHNTSKPVKEDNIKDNSTDGHEIGTAEPTSLNEPVEIVRK